MRVADDRGVHVGVAVEVELLEHERDAMVRVQLAQRHPDVRSRRDRRELEVRMAVQDAGGEGPRVARGTGDQDRLTHAWFLDAVYD